MGLGALGKFVPAGTVPLTAGAVAGLMLPGYMFAFIQKKKPQAWITTPGWGFVAAKVGMVLGLSYAVRRFGGPKMHAVARGFMIGGLASSGLDVYALLKAKGFGISGWTSPQLQGWTTPRYNGMGETQGAYEYSRAA
jgi:hypothetical protein